MQLLLDKPYNKSFKESFVAFCSQRVVYHAVFWLVVLTLFLWMETFRKGIAFTISNEVINLLFYAVIVYVNIFYLIPNYLSKKKFFTYVVFLIALSLLITPIKLFVFHFKWEAYPELQNILFLDQSWYYASSLVAAGTSTILKIIGDWLRHQREKQELETRNVQSELKFLKSQINPHFLFNTLNSIYALSLKKSDKAPEIVVKLSEMLRYMLYECNELSVPLEKEVKYIENYLSLEKLRHGEKLEIDFKTSGRIDGLKVSPLMFVPFLENAFKHGANNHLDSGYVHASLDVLEKNIQFKIENSKPDAIPVRDHQRKSGGIGLVNIRRRLNILYYNQHVLEIEEKPDSYTVHLDLLID